MDSSLFVLHSSLFTLHSSLFSLLSSLFTYIMDNFYLTSFRSFFKIGMFTLGGGYAMIPIIEAEVVDKRKWIERADFIDIVAIAQSCPGVMAVNMSTFIGYRLRKTKGAFCLTLATALPSFIIILLIAMFFKQFQDNAVVESIFRGIRPAVVALIAAPTFSMAKSAHINLANCWIPVGCALLIYAMHVNPIYIIIAAAVGGYLYGRLLLSSN